MDIDPIRPGTISELAVVEQQRCLSLYMPTHHTGREVRQDPIRLSNLLDQVHSQLTAQDMRRTDIEAWLNPVRELIRETNFWRFQGASLAIFLADGVFRILRMPTSTNECVTLGPRFNLKPLLESVAYSEPFYILALTKDKSRFYRATRSEFEEVEDAGFPLEAVDVVGIRDAEPELQHHSGKPPRGGRGDRGHRSDAGQAHYHGQGDGEVKLEADTIHYIKEVAERVGKYLYHDPSPLVVAADISLFGLYRREHSRGRLVESSHVESPDALRDQELHENAWNIVAPSLAADVTSLLDQFETANASSKGARGYSEVAVAASQGRVDTLLFDPRATQLGWIDDDQVTVHLVEAASASQNMEHPAEDLVNRAIVDTLRAGGRAVPLAFRHEGALDNKEGDSVNQIPLAILRY
jgi:hypothetical protein